jgi:hypothetical protein
MANERVPVTHVSDRVGLHSGEWRGVRAPARRQDTLDKYRFIGYPYIKAGKRFFCYHPSVNRRMRWTCVEDGQSIPDLVDS